MNKRRSPYKNLIVLAGRSSSGKNTIYNMLRNDTSRDASYEINYGRHYTTRPPRPGEENGEGGYVFTTEEEITKFREEGKVIEERSYETVHGIWTYATIDDGNLFLPPSESSKGSFTIINSSPDSYIKAYNWAKENGWQYRVYCFYLWVPDSELLLRQVTRELEKDKDKQDFPELVRRYKDATNPDYKSPGLDFNPYHEIDSYYQHFSNILDIDSQSDEWGFGQMDNSFMVNNIKCMQAQIKKKMQNATHNIVIFDNSNDVSIEKTYQNVLSSLERIITDQLSE